MSNRFFSFLRSGNKRLLLDYYFSSLLAQADVKTGGRLFAGSGVQGKKDGRINLAGQTVRKYGSHRSGWSYAVSCLTSFHHPEGTMIDTFADLSFSSDASNRNVYRKPWIGFLHVPPGVPGWLSTGQSNEAIFSTDEWQQSLPHCRGLFTLSEYHTRHIAPLFTFPVVNLFHPTEFPANVWDPEKFKRNPEKKLIQVGWWLRKTTSIYFMKVPGYRRMVLKKQDASMERLFRKEIDHLGLSDQMTPAVLSQVHTIKYLPNEAYDNLLCENVVFLDLFDASANNAVIECIARATPLLVNPHEAVVEYLGPEYPLYFNTMEEAEGKAADMDLVVSAHRYLLEYGGRERLRGDYFARSFEASSIYKQLPVPAR